ncbi:unnamed protein product, partial [Mesorhabditis spiculigera]
MVLAHMAGGSYFKVAHNLFSYEERLKTHLNSGCPEAARSKSGSSALWRTDFHKQIIPDGFLVVVKMESLYLTEQGATRSHFCSADVIDLRHKFEVKKAKETRPQSVYARLQHGNKKSTKKYYFEKVEEALKKQREETCMSAMNEDNKKEE